MRNADGDCVAFFLEVSNETVNVRGGLRWRSIVVGYEDMHFADVSIGVVR